jgi:hypothetical protein
MLRWLGDENLNGDIIRGLFLRQPDLDLVRVQDVGLIAADDRAVLAWAAENSRIVLTHDRATMPNFACDRLAEGFSMAGLAVINDQLPIRQAIDEIILLENCMNAEEWEGLVLYLPL